MASGMQDAKALTIAIRVIESISPIVTNYCFGDWVTRPKQSILSSGIAWLLCCAVIVKFRWIHFRPRAFIDSHVSGEVHKVTAGR